MKFHGWVAAACAATALTSALAQSGPLQEVIAGVTANGLQADVSFLASDALKGRATPSAGLDIAAEYIAAQFRRAGLEPAGDDGFFQTAHYSLVTPRMNGLELTLESGGAGIRADRAAVSVEEAAAVVLHHAAAVKLTAQNAAALSGQLAGKVVFLGIPNTAAQATGDRRKAAAEFARLRRLALSAKPAVLVMVEERTRPPRATPPRLREASGPNPIPVILVSGGPLPAAIAAAKPGLLESTVSARVPAPSRAPMLVRNVVGMLPGGDPKLKDTFVVLSAHYDHIGVSAGGSGDRIFNGANDNASGTATVIEAANALSALPKKPKRSILFVAFFGEELGLVGSRYYVAHPAKPLAATVADINLEQMGRTDDLQGRRLLQFNATGFDYTNLMDVFQKAGEETGIRAVNDRASSDGFFSQSDNLPFADAGVPSTTVSVTYEFPDYHKPGDEWPKLDYENMAKVDRAVAWGVWLLAEDPQAPRWNPNNPAAARYGQARPTN